jgi:hypothetical protein
MNLHSVSKEEGKTTPEKKGELAELKWQIDESK